MQEVLITAITDFGLYSLFVVIYTLVGAYQNINIWGMTFDWKIYLNGLVKWLVLGASVVGTAVASFLLLAQAEAQGVQLVDVQAVAPRVIFALVLVASAVMLGKIVTKLATTLGVSEEKLKEIQEASVNTPEDKPLVIDLDELGLNIPTPEYPEEKLQAEQDLSEGELIGGVGAVYNSVPISSYSAFRAYVLGRGFDVDGYYGYQCWDGTALLWQRLGLNLITGNGLAIGCWDLKRNVNKYTKFDLVTSVNSLKKGDVVVMRPNHIGFFDGYDGNYMRILGQNQGGTPKGVYNSEGFNVVRIAKSAFAGAFRYKGWNTPKKPATPKKSSLTVAKEIVAGKGNWGTGDVRKARLKAKGYSYATVQNLVNKLVASKKKTPAKKPTAKIKKGDVVKPIKLVTYSGQRVVSFHSKYRVSQLSGNRAVLTSNGVVWCAMNVNNLKKVS